MTHTVPCSHCNGSAHVRILATDTETSRMVACGSCMGRGKVEEDGVDGRILDTLLGVEAPVPLSLDESFIYVCATRYAINRQTYAGSTVIKELTRVADRMPYDDRKLLEKEIAHALSTGEVDAVTRDAWVELVDHLRELNTKENVT